MGVGEVTVSFGTNRAESAAGDLFGSSFRVPTPADRRIYVTGSVRVAHTDATFRYVPGSMVLDPEHPAQVAGVATVPGIASGEVPADGRFATFARGLPAVSAVGVAPSDAGLFFLPGFANTFVGSVESAARIAVGYGAAKVICFSWPSLGRFGWSQYRADQLAAVQSGPAISLALTSLLRPMLGSVGGRPLLHLVTHSMGAHALSSALQTLGVASPEILEDAYFSHAALMAADEDADALREARALAPLLTLSDDVNVYTNAHDLALALSGQVNHRGALGLFGPQDLKTLPRRVVWLNCTVVADREEGSGYGHGYFDQSPSVMADVRQVFAGVAPAAVKPRVADPNPDFDHRRYTLGSIPDDA